MILVPHSSTNNSIHFDDYEDAIHGSFDENVGELVGGRQCSVRNPLGAPMEQAVVLSRAILAAMRISGDATLGRHISWERQDGKTTAASKTMASTLLDRCLLQLRQHNRHGMAA